MTLSGGVIYFLKTQSLCFALSGVVIRRTITVLRLAMSLLHFPTINMDVSIYSTAFILLQQLVLTIKKKNLYLPLNKVNVLHQVREQSRIVVVFPGTQANRSVPFSGAHSVAWGSTTEADNIGQNRE